jgi:hypothetical protein
MTLKSPWERSVPLGGNIDYGLRIFLDVMSLVVVLRHLGCGHGERGYL